MKTMKNEAFFSSKNIFRVVFISLMLIVFNINLIAQTEFSKNIVDTTKQWNEVAHSSLLTRTFALKISNEEVIIDGLKYNYIEESENYEESYDTWLNWDKTIFSFSPAACIQNLLIRESDGKVYTRTLGNTSEERMIYDFNLSVGDTFVSYVPFVSKYVVYSIDTVSINGNLLKRLYLRNESIEDEWIEGVGSINYPLIAPFNYITMSTSAKLLCLKQNNETVFINPDYNTCYLYFGLNSIDKTSVEIYPTLAKDEINIISNNNVPLDICFVNLSGKILKKIRLHSNEKIDISSLSSGVYNVIINKTYSKKIIKL